MKYTIGLGVALSIAWIGWSGHFDPLLLALGAGSVLWTLHIARKMGVDDDEGTPVAEVLGIIDYIPWLVRAIISANLHVSRRILQLRPAISPRMIRIEAEPTTAFGRVLLANSITLTPGTVTVDLDGNRLLIHALTEEAAEETLAGEKNRRVARVEAD